MQEARQGMTRSAESNLESKYSLEQVKDTKEEGDFDMIVPLTKLLYVPGRLSKG